MQAKTIISALAQIRREAINGNGRGRDEAEALLRIYGVDPEDVRVPAFYDRRYGRGEVQRAILRALKERPQTSRELELTVGRWRSVSDCLTRLRRDGVVKVEKRVWRLA